ncbi:MAG: alkaline phosphatase family protein [Eubacteriales bacterium]|nr:alkaline phosphatase family protein [Eubacteriales bacterium]
MCRKAMADCYAYMKEKLKHGKLCVLYLDGLGYRMYEEGKRRGALAYIQSAFSVEPLLSVEPPVTNPNMATMLTGRPPEEHGIQSRRDKIPNCPTIFADAVLSSISGNAVLLEGDSSIIKTELHPILHTGREGKGTDYWIYRSVLKEIEKGAGFIFAHFHEIDDCAHTYGTTSEETMKKIQELDSYVKEIDGCWNGAILLISDHGLHDTETGGTHGDGCQEDRIAIWGEKILQTF